MQLSIMRTNPAAAGDPVEFRIVGSIDLGTRQALLDAVAEALTVAQVVEIDAGGIDFVDSTGISALIELGQAAERQGAKIALTRQSPQLRRVLDLVGVEPLLTA